MAGVDPALVLALQNRMAGDQLTILEDPQLGGMVLDLDEAAPEITQRLLAFLEQEALGSEALYVLGDLFEAHLGDDDRPAWREPVEAAFRKLASTGTAVHFLPGNRDFLLGAAFAARCGGTALEDPFELRLHGTRILVTHGDALCTDDRPYQVLRATVRDPAWQRIALRLPLATRQAFAAAARQGSREHTAKQQAMLMDVNAAAVDYVLRASGCDVLLHGHTHRPGLHELVVDGRACRRIVLGDWYTQRSALRWDEHGPKILAGDNGRN